MSNKQKKYLFKNTSFKFFILLWFSSLLIGLVYAAGIIFPGSTPLWMTQNGSFSTRFANMFVSCPANEFLKGFDTSLNRICVPSDGTYGGPVISITTTATSGAYPTNAPTGQIKGGKFAKYFENLYGLCSGNKIVKGFASDGWKYCVTPAISTDITPHTPLICTKVPGCVEKLLRKITQVRDIIDKQDFVPKVSQISPLVSGI